MAQYEFSTEKNAWLQEHRRICFEEIILAIENGHLLEIIEHLNQERYPNQKMYAVDIDGYVHLVPFIHKNEQTVFLKTIFKSRKMTRHYLGR